MNKFLSVDDAGDPMELVKRSLEIKKNPLKSKHLGENRTLGLIFLNPSLRTRLSTVKAAQNLGINVISMTMGAEGWQLEYQDGVIMDAGKAEHVKEAAAVVGQYCDVIGVRSFPGLENREEDYADLLINSFVEYSGKPVISLESATRHPLQSLTDLLTIEELKKKERPKVVLTWAPHIKALPQAVPNSFAEWVNKTNYEFVIAHPEGLELDPIFSGNALITHDQDEALADADFVYAKNWSSYQNYGKLVNAPDWIISNEKMALTNNGCFMHCLPVRRNIVVKDEVLDGDQSVVIHQAGNRVFAAQAVLEEMLTTN